MKKILPLVFCLLLALSGCSSGSPAEDPKPADPDPPAAEAPEALESATVVGLTVSVRQAPDTGSDRVGTLDFPQEVQRLEKSPLPETIGGREAHWYRVRSGDLEGWCFGAFLATDEDLPKALEDRIEDLLPTDKSTTVAKSVSTLKNILALNGSTELADEGLLRVQKLQETLLPGLESEMQPLTEKLYSHSIEDLRNPETLPEGEIRTLMERYRDMGYSVYMAEGMYYLDPSPRFLLGNFKADISDELYDYLTYRSEEVDRHTYSDAAVIITWDELADRMVSWEKFMDTYPDSAFFEEARSMYDMYRFSFFIGTSNTPAYTYPTEILDPELLAAYENYLARYPDSALTPVLEDLLALLEQEGYQKTEKIQAFLDPYNPWH